MKKMSKRTKIVVLSILSVLILIVGVSIVLSMLSYEDPVEQETKVVPLGDYDYSKRPFFIANQPVIYKADVYWSDPRGALRRTPLDGLSCDLRTTEDVVFPDSYPVCTDNSHDHASEEKPEGCLDYNVGFYLIDAYESGGESPIIYHINQWTSNSKKDYEIIRYDTGNMSAETIVAVSDQIMEVMVYDRQVFFTTRDSNGVYSLNVISKTGGDLKTMEVGKHGWSLKWANDLHVYYQDSAGNIYRAAPDFQNPEFVFYAETISAMDAEHVGTFFYGNHLYYEADYEIVPYAIGSTVINFAKHSIRRVSLDNLQGESELVAENVLDNYVFGVGNNVLYYQPCVMAESVAKKYYFNWTGGQLLGVDLDTLEPAEMVNDVGLDIDGKDSYASGNAVFVLAMPTDGRYHQDRNSNMGVVTFLLDTRTGALYPFSVNMILG